MKSFPQFLSEAIQSQAAMQAKKLGLTGDRHGGWIDRSGKVVARTDKGKLKFIDGNVVSIVKVLFPVIFLFPAVSIHNIDQL